MSRPLRIELADGLYHVTSRGDRREAIFADDGDRHRFLDIVAQATERFDAKVVAYCLMGNHYHFVLHTRQPNLSRLMRHINGVYSQSFNRRHGLVGHLFQGRFKAIHVDRDAYFLEVCRYVELNPVRACIVPQARDWAWSSYRAHIGAIAAPGWLDTPGLHARLLGQEPRSPDDIRQARHLYAELVAGGLGVRLWESALSQDIYLGGAEFVLAVQQRMRVEQAASAEIPRSQTSRPAQRSISMEVSNSREAAMRQEHLNGVSMRVIALQWGLSISRVSRLIRRAEQDHD
jgi:putative transposase